MTNSKLNKAAAISKINELVELNISFSVESYFEYGGRFGTSVLVTIEYTKDGDEYRIEIDGRARASVQKFMCELNEEKYICEKQNVTYSWEAKQVEENKMKNLNKLQTNLIQTALFNENKITLKKVGELCGNFPANFVFNEYVKKSNKFFTDIFLITLTTDLETSFLSVNDDIIKLYKGV